jgi:hypothetical protein
MGISMEMLLEIYGISLFKPWDFTRNKMVLTINEWGKRTIHDDS